MCCVRVFGFVRRKNVNRQKETMVWSGGNEMAVKIYSKNALPWPALACLGNGLMHFGCVPCAMVGGYKLQFLRSRFDFYFLDFTMITMIFLREFVYPRFCR